MDLQPKKSEQLKNNGVVLVLNSHSTKTKSETLGDVELKYVSYGDTIEFTKILQEDIKDRDFVAKILFRQLVKPEINFDEFQKISNVELERLAKVFVKNENHTFKYFRDTGNYFKDFRQALFVCHEKYNDELRKTFEPIIKSTQETLTAFSKNYSSVIQQAIEQYQATAKIIAESLRPQIDFWQKWTEQNKRVFDSFSNYLANFQKTYNIAEQKAVGIL